MVVIESIENKTKKPMLKMNKLSCISNSLYLDCFNSYANPVDLKESGIALNVDCNTDYSVISHNSVFCF